VIDTSPFFVCGRKNYADSSMTVHLDGIPDDPVVQDVMPAALTKVPVEETPLSHEVVQEFADMSVARHLTCLSLVQP